MSLSRRIGWASLALGLAGFASGCGTPGAPQPPSLNLPDPVENLSATRTGNQVALSWTMPKRNTDKLPLTADVAVRVCRREESSPCQSAGNALKLSPDAMGEFVETLPPALVSGSPRTLSYFVELTNRNGRAAGFSNAAIVLAGQAPGPVVDLAAEVRKDGIVLRWAPGNPNDAIRLHRKLLTRTPSKPQQGLLGTIPEQVDENLLVDSQPQANRAIDKDIHLGQTYEYRAQRISRVTVDGKAFELAGEISAPLPVEAKDVFPPATPIGLAAVATIGENPGETAIDLSWQPITEADLAGYIVYRREGDESWQRISPAPSVAPAFHDTHVQPGHTYSYSVSAIDQGGHESAHSAEAQETVAAN